MRALTFRSLALLVTLAPAAFAQEEAKGGMLTPHGGLMIWTLLIFVLLWFVLSKLAFPPILAAVEQREKSLEDAIEGAKRDREAAAKVLAEHQAAMEGARADAQRFIAEGKAAGEKLKADMLEQTRAQQAELLERARREIETEKTRAIADLRREAVDLAIAGAGKVIEKNLDDASNRQLVERFLGSITPAAAQR